MTKLKSPPHMADSLRPHRGMSSRLHNGLLNFGSYYSLDLDGVVKMYREDPDSLERAFLRTPNCGRKTYDELTEFCDEYPDDGDLTGRVIEITVKEAKEAAGAIAEVCHHVSSSSDLYRHLRAAQSWLAASCIRIEP